MRSYVAFLLAALLLAGCAKEPGPQRLDFVNTARYTSSNRVGLNPADTLASRVFAENNDLNGPGLGRLVITVQYQPRRDPFLYPTPLSSFNRDSIDKSSGSFVYLDSTLSGNTFSLINVFGVRTTTGSERWQYDLYSSASPTTDRTASRAVRLGMRRPDSLAVFHDYTFKLVIPAVGVGTNNDVRRNSARRFLHLRAGLALPAYTVVRAIAPDTAQAVAQRLTDLIILSDGLTLVSPSSPTLTTVVNPAQRPGLSASRWPAANRRRTRIFLTGLATSAFENQADSAAIRNIYATAANGAPATAGQVVGPVATGQIYAFRTDESLPLAATQRPSRYGLLQVVSIPTSTTTTASAGLQLRVRMAK
ncbi:MAG TPA: hypothetical protein VFO93_16295 [Hymenobacter sp.]|uniref:hypothetical protein n=1 Tax=Hymenobacter sp. TaxID=1898978 RepID=UPI002D7FB3F4|nr:hypothetical protein [Hymenobacter sp.]HET9505105.1 hypothetical protein [Hymenobacter sp.]